MFEVQTAIGNDWENVWSEGLDDGSEQTQYYDTHDDAMAAIHEFFADLYRVGMAHGYQLEDYRVRPV